MPFYVLSNLVIRMNALMGGTGPYPVRPNGDGLFDEPTLVMGASLTCTKDNTAAKAGKETISIASVVGSVDENAHFYTSKSAIVPSGTGVIGKGYLTPLVQDLIKNYQKQQVDEPNNILFYRNCDESFTPKDIHTEMKQILDACELQKLQPTLYYITVRNDQVTKLFVNDTVYSHMKNVPFGKIIFYSTYVRTLLLDSLIFEPGNEMYTMVIIFVEDVWVYVRMGICRQ